MKVKTMIKKYLHAFATLSALVLGLTIVGYSQTSPSKDFPNIKISNFGKMDDHFYRGAQPKKGQYASLKELGINTVIDLQAETEDYARTEAEAAGLRYVNVPIVDKSYPTAENIEMFLKTVDDPATGVFYVHCADGRHRTGDMGALYLFTKYGWGYDQAYKEMKNYDFYTSWGHGKQKDFVIDYAAKMETAKAAATTSAVVTSSHQ